MAFYSFSHEVTPASNAAVSQVLTTANNEAIVYMASFGSAASPTSAPFLSLGKPATLGTASTTAAWLAEDQNGPVGTTLIASAWSVAPTVPANFYRIHHLFHAGLVFMEFPKGLSVKPSGSLILWNATNHAGAVTEVTWQGSE